MVYNERCELYYSLLWIIIAARENSRPWCGNARDRSLALRWIVTWKMKKTWPTTTITKASHIRRVFHVANPSLELFLLCYVAWATRTELSFPPTEISTIGSTSPFCKLPLADSPQTPFVVRPALTIVDGNTHLLGKIDGIVWYWEIQNVGTCVYSSFWN